MSGAIRILVVDDHPVVREGLVTMLRTQPDFEVVGEAGEGARAVEIATAGKPDVVLLDLEMPGMDGIEALAALRGARPDVRVIVFTAFDTDERIFAAVRGGAKGYLLKGTPRQELFAAIRTVHAGGSLLQSVVASKLMEKLREDDDPRDRLSAREMEVLEVLARGLQNREIARHLGISERTVKFHVSSILTKLDVTNRTEAVTIAVQKGLLKL